MKFPDYPRSGMDVVANVTQIINWLRASKITSVQGGRLKESPNGSILEIDIPTRTANAASAPAIGRLVLVSASTDDDPPAPAFSVTSGYVNSQIPTLDAVSLDADPAPVQEITANKAVWIKVVGTFSDGGSIPDDEYVITIETSADEYTPPVADEITPTGFIFSKILGTVTYTAAVGETPASATVTPIYQGGDINCDSFGSIIHWWQITPFIPEPPAP